MTRLPLAFIRNDGQWDTDAHYVARRGGLTARLEPAALVLQAEKRHNEDTLEVAVVRLDFEDCSPTCSLQAEDRLPGRYNYFLGNDPDAWRTRVPAFRSVLYRGVHEGIDLRMREGQGGILEYDLLVAPGADLASFSIRCEGADRPLLELDGSLVFDTAAGPIRMLPPTSWEVAQDGSEFPITCRYRLLGADRIGFEAPDRHLELALVVDPGLIYSTFLGGSNQDSCRALALDASGAAIIAGDTKSANFPWTPGAFSMSLSGTKDAFVARLSPDGARLRYATLLGGSASESATAIAIGAHGAVTVAGETGSLDFPFTSAAFGTLYNGGGDAFVTRLDMLPTGAATYGSSTAGCTGPLPIGVGSWPQVGNLGFSITCGHAWPGMPGILAISDAALATMQTVHGAQVWIDLASPLLFHLVPTANAIGATEVFLPIPNDPALANLQAFAQFAWPDPCLPGGMAASNALALTIQP